MSCSSYEPAGPNTDICKCGSTAMEHLENMATKDPEHIWRQHMPNSDSIKPSDILKRAYETQCEPEREAQRERAWQDASPKQADPRKQISTGAPIRGATGVSIPPATPSAGQPTDWSLLRREFEFLLDAHARGQRTGEDIYKWLMQNVNHVNDALRAQDPYAPVRTGRSGSAVFDDLTLGEPAGQSHSSSVAGGSVSETVHILDAGRTLCGKMSGSPFNWPKGHTWVSVKDAHHSTCHDCTLKAVARAGAT